MEHFLMIIIVIKGTFNFDLGIIIVKDSFYFTCQETIKIINYISKAIKANNQELHLLPLAVVDLDNIIDILDKDQVKVIRDI